MLKKTNSVFAITGALAISLLIGGGGVNLALAQEGAELEEVVVTGSRIARNPNLTNVSPVVAVNADEFLYQGIVRTEDLLNNLPSIYAGQDAGQANGATGTATVSLRGLDSVRTLVLVNGRRLPPGTPGQGGVAPDLNQIPSRLVDRVDVLTGGSSATYGSDAVAGVVNFITIKDFEGFALDFQTSGYRHTNDNSHVQGLLEQRRSGLAANNDPSAAGYELPPSDVSDGDISSLSLMFGVNNDKGNVTAYYQYRDVKAVLQRDRDYSRCDLGGLNSSCGGSGTIPNGRFTNFAGLGGRVIEMPASGCPANSVEFTDTYRDERDTAGMMSTKAFCYLGATGPDDPLMPITACPAGTREIRQGSTIVGCTNPDGFGYDFIPGTGANAGTFQARPSSLLYNYNPTNFYQRPDEQHTFGFMAHYEIAPGHEVYAEATYNDNHTAAQIAFSGNFFVTNDLFCGNTLLSEQQFNTLCGQFGLSDTQSISNLVFYSPETTTDDGGTPDDDEDDVTRITGIAVAPVDAEMPMGAMAPPTSMGSLFIGKRNVEGAPRSDDLRHTSIRGVFGAKGELPDGWSYDAYGLYSEVQLEETYNNDLSIERIRRALDVVAGTPYDHDNDPATDPIPTAVCRSTTNGVDASCIPWNLFYGQGFASEDRNGDGRIDHHDGITPEAASYLVVPLYARGTTDQKVFSGYIAGDLGQYGVKLPSASSGVEIATGLEYRSVNIENNPDSNFQRGDGAGQGGATLPIAGGWDVDEWFLEVSLPIADGITGIQDMRLELAYRSSSYSTGNDTNTHKVGFAWQPIHDLTFRLTQQKAVRHPNVYELFLGQGNNLTDIQDPCAQDEREAAGANEPTLAQCMLTGVTQLQYEADNVPTSPAGQYNFLQGGNPNLEPEESDTFSFGVIYEPSWADGLDVSVDYFDINVEKAIASISSQTILDECIGGNAALCGFINRGPDGNLWLGNPGTPNYGYIEGLQTNIGFFATKGLDITANYEFEVGTMGTLNLATVATYLTEWEQEEFEGAGVVDCVGYWSGGCGDPTFELVNNFRATWHTPWDLDLSLSWRHLPEVESLNPSHVDLDSIDYFDMAVVYRPIESLTLRGGLNNMFDEEPPLFGSGSTSLDNGNTWPGLYDALGQYWFLGFSYTLAGNN